MTSAHKREQEHKGDQHHSGPPTATRLPEEPLGHQGAGREDFDPAVVIQGILLLLGFGASLFFTFFSIILRYKSTPPLSRDA